jgi:transcriptional regulator with XRE-family HTH domain
MTRRTPTKDDLKNDDALFLEKLAKRIKDLRIKAGYTSYETFAYEAGISRTMYGNYENGSDMRTTNLRKIAKAHNMTLEEFFSEGFD